MDILKKAVLLVAILSISVFMTGCGGEEAADNGGEASETEAPAGDAVNLGDLIEKAQDEKAQDENAQDENAQDDKAEE